VLHARSRRDWLSTTLGHGRGSELRTLAEVRNPTRSVRCTRRHGVRFAPELRPGKVWASPRTASDRYVATSADLIHLTPHGLSPVNLTWFGYHCTPTPPMLSGAFFERFGPARARPESELSERHEDLPTPSQALTEEARTARGERAASHDRLEELAIAAGLR